MGVKIELEKKEIEMIAAALMVVSDKYKEFAKKTKIKKTKECNKKKSVEYGKLAGFFDGLK